MPTSTELAARVTNAIIGGTTGVLASAFLFIPPNGRHTATMFGLTVGSDAAAALVFASAAAGAGIGYVSTRVRKRFSDGRRTLTSGKL